MTTYTGTTTTNRVSRNASGAARQAGGRTVQTAVNVKKLLSVAFCVLFAFFVLIGLQAYTATLQHDNNELKAENEFLMAEIDSLKSQIVEETKVAKIEKTATKKYGMVYPTEQNCITIDSVEPEGKNLAAVIRNEAYN